MWNGRVDPKTSAFIGLLLAIGTASLGIIASVVAINYGAPRWLSASFVAAQLAGLAAYIWLTFFGHLKTVSRVNEREDFARKVEVAFEEILQRLQAGDLTSKFQNVRYLPDHLMEPLVQTTSSLAGLVQQIQTTSIQVATAGNTVQANASELASGSSEQAAAVVEITATMEELARTAAQIASNAASQADLSGRAEHSGNIGAAAMEEAVTGVEEVQKRIGAIAHRADTLGSRSKEIYRVLDLITEIAQETHILSLNAAIESAAAGEHGRRFAVVADEVRRLAQRAQESVESVRNLLEEFANSIRATVVATEEGSKEAARVLERARSAAYAIDELRQALSETAQTSRETSLATEQQRTASDQVVLTLKEVSHVIQRMAEGLQSVSGTADHLNEVALGIQLLTQSFVIESPRSLKYLAEKWAEEIGSKAGLWGSVEEKLREIVKSYSFIEITFMTDTQGTVLAAASVGDETLPIRGLAAASDRPWFMAAKREGRAIITQIYDSLASAQRCFTVAAPVYDKNQQFFGVVGFDVNVRSWTKI